MESLFDLIEEIIDGNNDKKIISKFISRVDGGENINIKNDSKIPLISEAALTGSYEIFNSLIKQGAKLKGADRLMRYAAMGGSSKIFKKLLDEGFKIDYIALDFAAKEGHLSIVKIFLESGIDVNHQEDIVVESLTKIETKSDTMLSSAALYRGWNDIEKINNKIDTINYLLDNGADINLHGKFGNTALHWAAGDENIKIVELLLEKGANIKLKNDKGERAFNYADKKHKKIKALIK